PTRSRPPLYAQVVKTYLRAIQALGKFHQQPEVPYPPPAEGEFTWAKEAMHEILARWSEKLCSRSIKLEDFYDFANELIGAFIKALSLQQPAPEEPVGPRDASAVANALRGVPRAAASIDQTNDTQAR